MKGSIVELLDATTPKAKDIALLQGACSVIAPPRPAAWARVLPALRA